MSSVLTLLSGAVLAVGATVSITRLITTDKVLEPLRGHIAVWCARSGQDPEELDGIRAYVTYLISCPWCASFWIGLVVTTSLMLWPSTPLNIIYAALTLRIITGGLS